MPICDFDCGSVIYLQHRCFGTDEDYEAMLEDRRIKNKRFRTAYSHRNNAVEPGVNNSTILYYIPHSLQDSPIHKV